MDLFKQIMVIATPQVDLNAEVPGILYMKNGNQLSFHLKLRVTLIMQNLINSLL